MKRRTIVIASLALFFTVGGYFVTDGFSDVKLGAVIHNSTLLPSFPMLSTDNILVERGSVSYRAPATTNLQAANNLSDVAIKANSRNNLGFGSVAANTGSVSIMDFPSADPTGGASSDAAFVSCTTSGKNCYIPQGTFLINCATHNASNGILIYGDDWRVSTIRVPTGCTFPTGGLINLASMQNITVDVNSNTVSTEQPVVSNVNGATVNLTPSYLNMQVTRATTNMDLIKIAAAASGNVQATIRNSALRFNAAATATPTKCISVVDGTTSHVTAGLISDNVCVNGNVDVLASDVTISNNDISGWNFGAGIQTEQSANSNNMHIFGNKVHDSGFALDAQGNPANGILNYAKSSAINNNRCWNLGGACIDNGGQNSIISANWAYNNENRTDNVGTVAYFTLFVSSTFNGNNSSWIGNYAIDDRGAGAKQTNGYQDQTGTTGVSLSGNQFFGVTRAYVLN